MNRYSMPLLLGLILAIPLSTCASEAPSRAVGLSNEGVLALEQEDWAVAIDKLSQALIADPDNGTTRSNLAIAHNNFGIYLGRHYDKPGALKQFHQAQFLEGKNPLTIANLNKLIKLLGKNPNKFADRVTLGDHAKAEDDPIGAVVEYEAALKLKNDPETHRKLGDIYRQIDQGDKAAAEYDAAARKGRQTE